MLGGGFGIGLCFAEGGLRSREGSRGVWGQLCQLTAPQCVEQLFLSTGPAAIFIQNVTGAESLGGNFRAAEEHDLDILYPLSFSTPYSPSPGPFATSLAFFMPHYLHRGDAELLSLPMMGRLEPDDL